jgi:hypothetical protein
MPLALLLAAGALVVAFAYALPAASSLSRSTIIHAPPDSIFAHVADLRTWPEWTYWSRKADAAFAPTFEGPESGEGATMRWSTFHGRSGHLRLVEASPDRGVRYAVEVTGFPVQLSGDIRLTPDGPRRTRVTWTALADAGDRKLWRYMAQMVARSMKDQLDQNLASLRDRVERSVAS